MRALSLPTRRWAARGLSLLAITTAACSDRDGSLLEPEPRPTQPQLSAAAGGWYNGHYYEVVSTGMSWTSAKNAAEGRVQFGLRGHLATITSAEENAFIARLGSFGWLWVGGFQPDGTSEPNGGWTWVTSEPFSYTNWGGGEPNNWNGTEEDRLAIHMPSGFWNDGIENGGVSGYVVEYDIPADVSPPVLSYDVRGVVGDHGWYRSDVSLSWTVTDPESSITSTSGCTEILLTNDIRDARFTCSATSAGGGASRSVTISRDATPPTVRLFGLTNYSVDQVVDITCAASDNLSGIAQTSCPLVAAGDAYSFAVGTNSMSATARDYAGNRVSSEISFTVTVDFRSMRTLTSRFVDHGSFAESLQAKLDAAEAAAKRGNENAKRGALAAFVHQLDSAAGRSFVKNADVLKRLVAHL